jgi:hypothetical protein
LKKVFQNNGLSLVLFGFFFLFLFGQSVAGYYENNEDQRVHHRTGATFGQYLLSAHFLEALFENWESEFLQMSAYVVLTAFLFQKGSAESKDPAKEEDVDEDPWRHREDPAAPAVVRQGGWKLKLYEHSLSLVLFGLFLLSFLGHVVTGAERYNDQQIQHGQPGVSLTEYVVKARFWFESFQNWQSEFLAVGAIVILSIWLRQRGSPESKPVASPHHKTGG